MFDFDILTDAPEGPELNPVFADDTKYTAIDDLILWIKTRKNIIETSTLLAQMSQGGVVIDDEMETYLRKPGCSSSALKEALKSPLHYYISRNMPEIRPDKKAFNLGTFCHMAFLQPELFDTLLTEPAFSLNTKEGVQGMVKFYEAEARKVYRETNGAKRPLARAKYWLRKSGLDINKIDGLREYLTQLKKCVDKRAVDDNTLTIINLIRRNYYDYGGGIIPELLKGAAMETSFYGTDEETGLNVKIRPDAFNIEENLGCNAIISFKTTHADSIEKFQSDAAKYMYHLAEGMYLDVASQVTGRKFTAVICVMLQTVSPYLPAVFIYDADDLANGKYRYRIALRNVREAIDKNSWPGFDSFAEEGQFGIIQMKLPEWSLREKLPQTIDV